MSTIKKYYQLTKPGIIYGNLLSTIAGYLFASHFYINIPSFFGIIVGTSLVIGSGCVFNNYIDRDIDAKMDRTKSRSFASNDISVKSALIYGIVLSILGFLTLLLFTNNLTFIIGFIGIFVYVIVYSFAKRTTILSTLIGSISGAAPILAGYTAASGRIDMGSALIFLIMALWQMPHFYAISIFRLQDYTNAGLMVWSVKRGVKNTKIQILLFIFLFTLACVLLTINGYKGIIFLILMLLLGLIWFFKGLKGFAVMNDASWGRNMFFFSLIVLISFCVLLVLPV